MIRECIFLLPSVFIFAFLCVPLAGTSTTKFYLKLAANMVLEVVHFEPAT
jgi:hypothetical protein